MIDNSIILSEQYAKEIRKIVFCQTPKKVCVLVSQNYIANYNYLLEPNIEIKLHLSEKYRKCQ